MATAGDAPGPGPERAFHRPLPETGCVRLGPEESAHLVRVRRVAVLHRRGSFLVPRAAFLARAGAASLAALHRGAVVFTRDLQLADLLLSLRRRARVVYEAHAVESILYRERGALYGIGIGIVLALSYWVLLHIFLAIGGAGLLPPFLAGWSANIIVAGTAAYLLLNTKT